MSTSPESNYLTCSITLEPLLHKVQHLMALKDLSTYNLSLDTWVDHELDAMVVALSKRIWTEDIGTFTQHKTLHFPSSWWQHFKEQYFPKWLLRFFPVKERHYTLTFTYTVKQTYPKLEISTDKLQNVSVIQITKKQIGETIS